MILFLSGGKNSEQLQDVGKNLGPAEAHVSRMPPIGHSCPANQICHGEHHFVPRLAVLSATSFPPPCFCLPEAANRISLPSAKTLRTAGALNRSKSLARPPSRVHPAPPQVFRCSAWEPKSLVLRKAAPSVPDSRLP